MKVLDEIPESKFTDSLFVNLLELVQWQNGFD